MVVKFDISLLGSDYERKWSLKKGRYVLTLDNKSFVFSGPSNNVSIKKDLVKKSGTRQKHLQEGDFCFLEFGNSSPKGSGVIRIYSSQIYQIATVVESMLKQSLPFLQTIQELNQDNKSPKLQSSALKQPHEDLDPPSKKGIFKWIRSTWKKLSTSKNHDPKTKRLPEPKPSPQNQNRKASLECKEIDEKGDDNYEYEYVYEYYAPTIDPSLKWHENNAAATEYCEDIFVHVNPALDGHVLVNEADIYSISQKNNAKTASCRENQGPVRDSDQYE